MNTPGRIDLYQHTDTAEWISALDEVGQHDIYHLPAYQQLSLGPGERAVLIVYRRGTATGVLPVILRPLSTLPWCDLDLADAVSAYGYPGPLVTPGAASGTFLAEFATAIYKALRECGCVAGFVRSNPLLSPAGLFPASQTTASPVVYINTSLAPDEQRAEARKKHRYELRQAEKAGISVAQDPSFGVLPRFIELYEQRMRELDAGSGYFFPSNYYERLRELPDESTSLWFARCDNKVVAAALFLSCERGIQYHLSASDSGFRGPSPIRVIIDAVRHYASDSSKSWLHLGGGAGGADDSLYRFKAGFSKHRAEFNTTRLVLRKDTYDAMTAAESEWARKNNLVATCESYFPQYRIPRSPATKQ